MIYLTSILKSIEVYCASTVTTNQLDFIISYTEKIQGTYVSKTVTGTTNSTSPVVMLPSSQVNNIIEISGISIINNDSSPNTITIRLVKTQGGYTTLKQVLLDVGEQMEYDGSQWHVMTSTGEIKTGSGGGGMVYPGVGIAVSTGASWDTSITDNSTNWDAAYSWVNTNGANAVTAYGWGNHASAGYLTGITNLQVTTALGYTPVTNARTLTINGTTYDLSANRSWTISAGTTYTFSTGLNDNAGTVTSNLSTGVSGGQSVIGGTASGNNLTLSSTSNATKGKILFGNSAYDEVNNRLGIGTITPSSKLNILTDSLGSTQTSTAGLLLQNSTVSTVGSQKQISPAIEYEGTSYFGGSNNIVKYRTYNLTGNNGADSDYAIWTLGSKVGTGAWSDNLLAVYTDGRVGINGLPSIATGTKLNVNGNAVVGTVSGTSTFSIYTYLVSSVNAATNETTITQNIAGGYLGIGANSRKNDIYINSITTGSVLAGNIGFGGVTSPTAKLHLPAGSATASSAPIKFTSGTNLTTAEAGVMEYNNTFHLTNSDATRRHIVTAPNTTKVTAAAPYTNDGYITVNIGGTDFKLMTTA